MKIRVPLWQQPSKYAVLDTADRLPATIGVNVYLPDGSLFRPESAAPAAFAPPQPIAWGSIQNVPAGVRATETMTGQGVVTRSPAGALVPKALAAGPGVTINETATTITLSAAVGGSTSFPAVLARLSVGA